jgi:hypothetical protein
MYLTCMRKASYDYTPLVQKIKRLAYASKSCALKSF